MAISSTGAFWTLDLVKKVPMFFPDTMLWMARSSCPLQMTTVVPLSRAQEAALTWKKTKGFLSRTNLIEDLKMLKKIVRGFLTQFC